MNPRVINVKPESDYTLLVLFTNGELRRFDVKPYLSIGQFTELKDVAMFNTAHPDGLSVEWANELAICPDDIYMNSVLLFQN